MRTCSSFDAIQVLHSAQVNALARDGGRRHEELVDRIFGNDLEFSTGLDDKRVPILAQAEHLVATGPWGRSERGRAGVQSLLVVYRPARLSVETGEEPAIVQHIDSPIQKYG